MSEAKLPASRVENWNADCRQQNKQSQNRKSVTLAKIRETGPPNRRFEAPLDEKPNAKPLNSRGHKLQRRTYVRAIEQTHTEEVKCGIHDKGKRDARNQ
jgi:hypothetical protein